MRKLIKFKSKKGLTLVEVVVSTIVGVIVIASACSTLYFCSYNYQTGTTELSNHQNASLVEEYLQYDLSCAKEIKLDALAAPISYTDKEKMVIFRFSGNILNIEQHELVMGLSGAYSDAVTANAKIQNVTGIDLKALNVDSSAKYDYEIHTARPVSINGKLENQTFLLKGGVVMNNLKGGLKDISLTNKDTSEIIIRMPKE